MSKKLTKEDFIEKARKVHGDKYDYSKVEYVNNHTKVRIICPEHGEFCQTPKRHVSGDGCPHCKIEKMRASRSYTNEKFISLAQEKYGNLFDYSCVEYKNHNTSVTIICKKHGKFEITPIKHLQNEYGCPFCYEENRGKHRRDTKEDFIEKAREIHGGKYDYSNVEYVNSRTKVCIICPEHGGFMVSPLSHIHGKKECPFCKKEKINTQKEAIIKHKEEIKNLKKRLLENKKNKFIEKARKVHGDRYDYSKMEYVNSKTKVCIICPEHGEFWQMPSNHLKGCNCPLCARDFISLKFKDTNEDFIEKARKVHGDKYDYSKVEYVNNHTKVCIICPEHGEFWQMPSMHTSERQGCPNCGCLSSKGENEVLEFIKTLTSNDIIQRDKTLLDSRKEIDIWIPRYNMAFEYDGLRWHSELFNKDKFYHLSKTLKCKEKNVNLIHIFEDEWEDKKDIVKEKIKHLLHIENKNKIYGRKCNIETISKIEAKEFLGKYHIQGFSRATVHYGAFYNKKLIAVMSFLRDKNENNWELVRFASDYNYVCCGVGGKLFKQFVKKHNPIEVKSFADRRWTVNEENNLYTKLGFELSKIIPPQYSYITPLNSCRKRYHKFNFRKQILHRKYGLSLSMTEKEMVQKLGYYKIYDCGLYKYIWKNDK